MTDVPPPPAPTPSSELRSSLATIDDRIPLKVPVWRNPRLLWPRLERAEAKVAFYAEYIEYLEARIAALESRSR